MEKTVQDIIDAMTDEQKSAVYAMVDIALEELEHSDLGDDYLEHFGVPGMRWGKRKSVKIQNKLDKLNTRETKLNAKADRLTKKAVEVDAKNSHKLYNAKRREVMYAMRGKEKQLRQAQLRIKQLELPAAKLRYKAADIKFKLQKNEKIREKLNKKLAEAIKKEESNN